eukprot:g3517.t1
MKKFVFLSARQYKYFSAGGKYIYKKRIYSSSFLQQKPFSTSILAPDATDRPNNAQKVKLTNNLTAASQNLPTLDIALSGIPELVPASNLEAPKTNITTLKNGLRVVTEETYGQCSTVGFLITAGSRFETPGKNQGVSHVLEQLAFKSTKNRTHAQIVREIEDLGIHPSLVAGREEFLYQMDVMRENVEQTLELLSDVVQNPIFKEEEMEEAKLITSLILEEMDMPQYLVNEELVTTAFGKDTPIGQPLLCDLNALPNISKETVKTFVDEHFCAENMILGIAGIEHDEAVKLAEKYFSSIPQKSSIPNINEFREIQMKTSDYKGGLKLVNVPDLPYTHVSIAFNSGHGWHGDDVIPACVLHSLLGGGDSFSAGGPGKGMYSRLYREVLNRFYWVESIQGISIFNSDCGVTGMMGSCEPDYINNLLACMCYQIKNLVNEPVAEIELTRARNRLKSTIMMSLESRQLLCEDLVRQVATYGKRESADEMCAKIDQVTQEDLMRVAKNAIASPPTVVVYGETKDIASNVLELVERTVRSS